jgi:hypothetical protein
MIETLKRCLWKQFAASIDMLKNAIMLCPESYWATNKRSFTRLTIRLVFFGLLSNHPLKRFFFTISFHRCRNSNIPEDAIGDVIPNHIYSKEELLDYLQACRQKCRKVISGLTAETLFERWIEKVET